MLPPQMGCCHPKWDRRKGSNSGGCPPVQPKGGEFQKTKNTLKPLEFNQDQLIGKPTQQAVYMLYPKLKTFGNV